MKKVCYIIFIVTTLSLRSLGALPIASYSYKSGLVENFDSMMMTTKAPTNQNGQTLWSVELWGSTEFAQNLTVASATEGGRSSAGFNAGAVNNTNRSLAIGKASAATFTTRFVNDTAKKLTEIELQYDMECPWVSKGKTIVSAQLFGQISTNGTIWVSLPQLDGAVSNSTTTMTDTWLTDVQMDAQKLSKRNVGGIIPLPAMLPSIAAGQTFFIRWVTDGDNASEKMTYGIDNLRTFADSDNDGLSDAKEVLLGTNPLNPDSDSDGMSDGEEIDYCTCPTNSASLFSIELKIGTPPSPELDNYIVEWPTADGRFYTLLFSEKMDGSFTPVEGYVRILGAIGTDAWCSHVTDSETGFYKVLIETE